MPCRLYPETSFNSTLDKPSSRPAANASLFAETSQPIHRRQRGARCFPTRPTPQPISNTVSSGLIPAISCKIFIVSVPLPTSAVSSVVPITCILARSWVSERADQTALYSDRVGRRSALLRSLIWISELIKEHHLQFAIFNLRS